MSKATLSVETQFQKVIADIEKLNEAAKQIGKSFEESAKEAGDGIREQEQRTGRYFDSLKRQGSGLAKNLKDDFKALLGLNMIESSLKLSNQFKGSIKEAFTLSDSIRKFGGALGIAKTEFGDFQSRLVRGLGEIGLSSEAASNVLAGLMGTGVKGEGALTAYSKGAGMLASVSNQKGSEGDIAKGMATVLRARGEDPSSSKAVMALSQDLNKAFQATGKGPKDLLDSMDMLFSDMAADLRKKVTASTMIEMAVAGQVAGPSAMKFLDEYLGKSAIERLPMDQMGMSGVIGKDGKVNFEKLEKAINGITSQIGGDPEMAARTLGISDEAATGLVRLRDSMSQVKEATNAVRQSNADLAESYKSSMGFGEAFSANLNRIKSILSKPLAFISNQGSSLLQKASESDLGATGVAAGGGILAALLAGGGLRGVKGMLGTGIKATAAEGITGQKTIPVYVTNIAEIAGASMGGSLPGKAGLGLLGKAGLVAGAGVAGYAAGTMIEPSVTKMLDKTTGKVDDQGTKWNIIERFFQKLDGAGDGFLTKTDNVYNPLKFEVEVRSQDPGIKAKAKGQRGAAQ